MCTKVNSKHIYFANLFQKSEREIGMDYHISRLRGLREDNDLSQEYIAELLGTSQTMYSRYERGATEMPIRHFVALCRFYKVSADTVLGLDGKCSKTIGKHENKK